MKRRMVAGIDKDLGEDLPKCALKKDLLNLADLITKNTRRFFLKMKMDQKFLTEEPGSWNDQPSCVVAESWYKESKPQMTLQSVG